MNDHAAPPVARHCDVAVVGGSVAGLAAALQLVRQCRPVLVLDDGEARNAPAAHAHGYLTRDGVPPPELTAAGREEVRSYGGEVLAARAERVSRTEDGRFRVELPSGDSVVARRVVAATGLVDELPEIEGIAERWGRDVLHCPFCHGFGVRDRRVVQIVTEAAGLHATPLLRHLSARLSVVVDGSMATGGTGGAELAALQAAGVRVVPGRVRRVALGDDGGVAAVELDDGERIDADAVVITPRFAVRAEPFAPLGLRAAVHASGLGDFVEADPAGATAVPGLYAAGNLTDPSQQLLQAAAQGNRVGAMIAFDLAEEDLRAAGRPSSRAADWDHRYSAGPLWSGNPNGTLVAQAGDLPRGRALDVGAGEGGDAVWLAEQGWTVTASDISQRALERIDAVAQERGLRIECRRADANAYDPFPRESFDLVSAQYASIPRTPDRRAVRNILAAVAPGGTLIVVNHDLDAMRAADPHGHGRPFDPDAYVRTDDYAAVLSGRPGWDIELRETRPRPPGAASASHHVDDIVLRARRHR